MAAKPLALRLLEQRKIAHQVYAFDATIRAADAVALHTGVDPALVYKTLVVEHDLSGLLRGDATARWTAYKTGREIGALSSEEIRRFENLGPKTQGDDYTPLRASPTPNEPIASTKP